MRRTAKKALLALVVSLAVLAFLEGVCSLATFGYDFLTVEPVMTQERAHTRYDELLGWSHVPGLYIGDLYGPGGVMKINAQGFRNEEDFPVQVPPGRIRLICSGDSFTMGYGVANKATWCRDLEDLDPRLQTVNMGQGGYGLDQAYLWYMRDGRRLQHQIHVLAFVTLDFGRMQADQFRGYGKPVLRVDDGKLVTGNVPVPGRAYYAPWLTEKLAQLDQLHIVKALRWLRGAVRRESPQAMDGQTRVVVSKLFETLRDVHRAEGSVLVLVYLPIRNDYDTDLATGWRGFVDSEARRLGIAFVDLVDSFKGSPRGAQGRMFRRDGHYTEHGNVLFAQALFRGLQGIPEVAALLSPAEQP